MTQKQDGTAGRPAGRTARLARLALRRGREPRPRVPRNALATKDVGTLQRHISA